MDTSSGEPRSSLSNLFFEPLPLPSALAARIGLVLMIFGGGLLLLSPAVAYGRWGAHFGISASPLVFVICGVGLLFPGIMLRAISVEDLPTLGRQISTAYRGAAILLLNLIVVFATLDIGARVLYELREAFSAAPRTVLDPRSKSPYYRSKSWAPQYWREFAASRGNHYMPHVLWRRSPFHGETININEQGIRLTPGANCARGSFKVFAFGGSTMWGTGSPDWATIPAYLQSGIQALKKGPVCVVNFGESGFTSTQSVIELLVQLQAGEPPNAVIFFDGPNDVYVGYQSGRVDVTENHEQMAERFNRKGAGEKNPVIALLEKSKLSNLAVSMVNKLKPAPDRKTGLVTYQSLGVDPISLKDSLLRNYFSNYKIVEGIAQEYGFKFLFFWPPYIGVGEKPLTPDEQNLKHSVDPALVRLYLLTYRDVERLPEKPKNLIYLGHIFDGHEPLLWLDEVHVTPDGNRLIAERMLRTLKERGIL